ncbi:MAG: DUF4304 domain-containing protein [Bacteroidota bacterium]
MNFLDSFLAKEGYEKSKKRTWMKSRNDALTIFQLQKSRYSDSYFLNVGLYFAELSKGNVKPSSIDDWHAEGRFEAITENTDFTGLFTENLNEENHPKMIQMFSDLYVEKVVPFLNKYSVLDNLKKDITANTFDYGKMVVAI